MIEEALRRQLEPVVDRRQRLSLAWRMSICWLACGLGGSGSDRRRPALGVGDRRMAMAALVHRRRWGHRVGRLPVPSPAAGLSGHCPNHRAAASGFAGPAAGGRRAEARRSGRPIRLPAAAGPPASHLPCHGPRVDGDSLESQAGPGQSRLVWRAGAPALRPAAPVARPPAEFTPGSGNPERRVQHQREPRGHRSRDRARPW